MLSIQTNSRQQGINSKNSNYNQSYKESMEYNDHTVFGNKRSIQNASGFLKQKDKDSLNRDRSLTSILADSD